MCQHRLILKEHVEVVRMTPRERMQRQTDEHIVDVPILVILDDSVEMVRLVPQEQYSERFFHIVDFPKLSRSAHRISLWVCQFFIFGIDRRGGEFGPTGMRATTDQRTYSGCTSSSDFGRDRRGGEFGPTATRATTDR